MTYPTLTLQNDLIGTYDLRLERIALSPGSWQSQVAGDRVIEVLELMGYGTEAELRPAEQKISEILEAGNRWFSDPFQEQPTWLNAAGPTEGAKRSIVFSGRLQQKSQPGAVTPLAKTGIALYTLTLERHPVWEADADTAGYSQAGLSCWGGKLDWTAKEGGDAPSRVRQLRITKNTGDQDEFWFGVRPAYMGVTDFAAVLELETGIELDADTALASEVGASPQGSTTNNKLRTTFATTSLTRRFIMSLNGAKPGINHSHFVGDYLVLLRCKVKSGSVIGVQMRYGFYDATPGKQKIPNQRVYVSNANYMIVPVGRWRNPPQGLRADMSFDVSGDFGDNAFEFYAEVITASGSDWIDWDAIGLVPATHLWYAKGADFSLASSFVEWETLEDDRQAGMAKLGGLQSGAVEFVAHDPAWPFDGGMGVLFSNQNAFHELLATADLSMAVRHRYKARRA